MKTSISARETFFQSETAAGAMLMLAAAVALALSNSPLDWLYDSLLATPIAIQIGGFSLDKPLLLWINDGLMAVFFFLVGLEIKRELVEGRLSTWKRASLPAIAAAGGMIAPALIYLSFNAGHPVEAHGWAIPAATDIAFAVAVLALLGRRVPASLKVFLLALAILDDLGAIVIIALFYTADLSLGSLAIAGVGAAILLALNLKGVTRFLPYLLVGIVMWVCVLKSGVHATLTGVVLAFAVPMKDAPAGRRAPLYTLEDALGPWIAFGVMPMFAFANAGVSLAGFSASDLFAPVPLGIALGLFLGKQAGIFGFSWIATRLGLCALPPGASWAQMYGVSVVGGIGFTMSLFIGTLAFSDPAYATAVRIGVLSGSILSGFAGYAILRYVGQIQEAAHEQRPSESRQGQPARV